MASDITQYVKLKTIVSYFLDENNLSMSEFDKAWLISFRCLVKLGLSISFEPETFRLPVNPNMTVTLPVGYLKWTKVGVINASGEVSFLKRNTSLTKFRDLSPNRLTQISPDIPDQDVSQFASSPYFYNYYFGNVYSPYFGAGGGTLITYGDFDVDEANGVIVLAPNYQFPDILLECIISPQQNNDYQIQICCQEAVISFLNWKFKLGSQQDFYTALIEARRSLKPIQLQELQQAIRESAKYSLKT